MIELGLILCVLAFYVYSELRLHALGRHVFDWTVKLAAWLKRFK